MLQITNLNESIAHCEAIGLSKCFEAYANNCSGEEIMEVGFNPNTGYVYIALENGLQICSCMGQSVDYLRYDFESDEEHFFNSYEEANLFN